MRYIQVANPLCPLTCNSIFKDWSHQSVNYVWSIIIWEAWDNHTYISCLVCIHKFSLYGISKLTFLTCGCQRMVFSCWNMLESPVTVNISWEYNARLSFFCTC